MNLDKLNALSALRGNANLLGMSCGELVTTIAAVAEKTGIDRTILRDAQLEFIKSTIPRDKSPKWKMRNFGRDY